MNNKTCGECRFYHPIFKHEGVCTATSDLRKTCDFTSRCAIGGVYSKPPPTIFDYITASIEVLAESVVYPYEMAIGGSTFRVYWTSPFVENLYPDKAEALAATVNKLKEVYNETTSN